MNYDLALFQSLNEEYKSRRLVEKPPSFTPQALISRGEDRSQVIIKRLDIQKGQRLLEIGCGPADTATTLAEMGYEVVGVDVREWKNWSSVPSSVKLLMRDITYDADDLGMFDAIFSFTVWEHLRHPFAMLKQVFRHLRPGGKAFISANLYRGPKASHLYREVFFPWPHLLFSNEVFEQFYKSIGKPPQTPAWVNKLTASQYREYCKLVGLEILNESYTITPIDEAFYARFLDVFECYPRYDLERDFIYLRLLRPKS